MDKTDLKVALLDMSVKYSENSTLRVATSSIPVIGAALDLLFSGKGSKWQTERVEQCLKELSDRLDGVSGSVQELNEDFYDLSIGVLEGVVKTKSKQKIKHFANILANKVLDENFGWDDAQIALSILSEMNDVYIQILGVMNRLEPYIVQDSNQEKITSLVGKKVIFMSENSFKTSRTAQKLGIFNLLPQYANVILEVACADLCAKGFLFDETVRLIGPHDKPIYSLTPNAEWFINHISDHEL